MNELKPCPFCGGKAEHFGKPLKGSHTWAWCTKCHVETPPVKTLAVAIRQWNRRPVTKSLTAQENDDGR